VLTFTEAEQQTVQKTNSNPWTSYKYTGSLRAVYPLSDKRVVPSHINRPDYADHPTGEYLKFLITKWLLSILTF